MFYSIYSINGFKKIANSNHISAWKCNGLSNEIVKHPVTFNNSLAPAVNYISTKTQVKFDDSCLKQDKVTFIHKKVENIFLVYEINMLPFNVGKEFAFKDSLF